MSMYKRSTPTERNRQLVEHINRYHEEFCKTDDPDKKLECLRLLKGYGTEYLNQVPHAQKFRTQRVEGVLTQSVYNLTDFDPREASEAFEHLAKYGQNLIDQPWREEFRTICLASGYYVHNIQSYLLNPHEILIAMGYTNIDDSTLQLATVPNPSYLKEVARDCFLASQECLVLSQIWDFVRTSTKYDVTCSEIYQYRREYVGDTQTIGQKICFDLRQRAYEESMKLQQKLSRQPSVYSQNNNKSYDNTCPVETLVDVDSAMNGMKVGEMPEREIVQKVLRNTQRQQLHHHQQQPENIYDPVADFDDLNFQPIKPQQQQQQPHHHHHHLSPESPSINSYFDTSSSYNNTPSDFGLPEVTPLQYNRYNSQTRSSTASPYIPQTVSAFSNVMNNLENEGYHHRKPSNCGSSSSGSGGYNQYPSTPSVLPLQYRKVSEDELLRPGLENHSRGTNNILDYPNWLEMEKNKHKYSSTVVVGVGANMNSRSNEGKDTLSTSLNPDNCLQEAFKYKSGVRELMPDGRKPIESSSYNHRPQGYSQKDSTNILSTSNRSNKSSTDNSSRVSSERESENNNNKSSASSSEASSWGYSQSYITEPSKITTESISRKKSLDKSQFPSSSSTIINKGMYETEHKQNYSQQQQQQQQYKETNLDTCENVFFQKLLSEGKDNYKTNNNNTTTHRIQPENSSSGMHTSSSFSRSNVKKGEHRETDLDAVPHESSHVEVDGKVLITSVDDETSWIKVDTNISPPNTSKRGTVPSSSSSTSIRHLQQQQQQQQEEEERETEQDQDQVVVVVRPWTCPHCTYCNYTSENVCEVCAKSKDFVFQEAPIPATTTPSMPKLYSTGGETKSVSSSKHSRSNSGGGTLKGLSKDNQNNRSSSKAKSPEDDGMINCPQCTVLNPKFRVICELCECRLKNRGED